MAKKIKFKKSAEGTVIRVIEEHTSSIDDSTTVVTERVERNTLMPVADFVALLQQNEAANIAALTQQIADIRAETAENIKEINKLK